MNPPSLLYVTSCENGLYGLRRLASRGIRAAAVVTIAAKVGTECRVSGFTEVHAACEALEIPVITLDEYRLRPADLGDRTFDLLVVNGWNRLIKPDVLKLFPLGGLGIHAGHPPIGLGRAPLPWNLIKGFRDIEVFVFRLTERADDGDIVCRRTVEITPQDDVRTLYEKVMFVGAELFYDAIEQTAAGKSSVLPQDRRYIVHYPKRTPDDGAIDFTQSVDAIYNFIRAQTRPYPGAFTYLGENRWNIWRAMPFDAYAFRELPRSPGRIVAALPSGLVVQTGTSPLWITEADCGGAPMIPRSLDETELFVGREFAPSPGSLCGRTPEVRPHFGNDLRSATGTGDPAQVN